MRTYRCRCENMLFFDNSVCLRCGKDVGYCPACRNITALFPQSDGGFRCGNQNCNTNLVKCANYWEHDVCNRCVRAEEAADVSGQVLCDCCIFNQIIPDLSVPVNKTKWYRLEAAKRRLIYDLDLIGLAYRFEEDDPRPKLRFDFRADVHPKRWFWWTIGEKEQVFTGHSNGLITINIREALDAERERLRVNFGEAHRTLIGHFRHEIAHYFWEVLIKDRDEESCKALFGDHESPSYGEALESYYKNGPLPNWQEKFVSAYSTMHPWEDFAETFATCLDMVSVIDTARNASFTSFYPRFDDIESMMILYKELGIGLNEISRSMGLLDVVPEMLVGPVREKMRYIYNLAKSSKEAPALTMANGMPLDFGERGASAP